MKSPRNRNPTLFLRACHTLSELLLDRQRVRESLSDTFSYQRSKTPQRYIRIPKMKTNTILFRKTFLSFSSFFSLFFFPFRDNKLWHLRAEEKFLNLVLIIPCLFRYAGSHVYLSPPVPGYMMYFLAWVSLYLIFFYFFSCTAVKRLIHVPTYHFRPVHLLWWIRIL